MSVSPRALLKDSEQSAVIRLLGDRGAVGGCGSSQKDIEVYPEHIGLGLERREVNGREISKVESPSDCRSERELGKGKWFD